MIYMYQKKGKFHVVTRSNNREVVQSSQPIGLSTRKAAIKNIRAAASIYNANGYKLLVQDDTGVESRMVYITANTISKADEYRPGPRYLSVPAKRNN